MLVTSAGCALNPPAHTPQHTGAPDDGGNTGALNTPAHSPQHTGAPDDGGNTGATDFDGTFGEALLTYLEQQTDGNYFVSPLSIEYALEMCVAGAEGKPLEGLLAALGAENAEQLEGRLDAAAAFEKEFERKVKEARAAYDSLDERERLYFKEPSWALRSANSAWLRDDLPGFTDNYMNRLAKFGAEHKRFSPASAAGSVNGWGDITEGFTLQYTWTVPHAFEDYMAIAGKKFLRDRLDGIFKLEMSDDIPGAHDIWGRIGGYWHGNEPCHHVLYLYNKLGKPEECQKWVRYVADHFYGNTPDALSGNDDCGQMSAWYIFNCLGFYPLCPGSNEYELGSPCLPGVSVRLSGGSILNVETKGWSPEHVRVKAVYLNGKKLKGTTLRYEDIKDGATLLFVMK